MTQTRRTEFMGLPFHNGRETARGGARGVDLWGGSPMAVPLVEVWVMISECAKNPGSHEDTQDTHTSLKGRKDGMNMLLFERLTWTQT